MDFRMDNKTLVKEHAAQHIYLNQIGLVLNDESVSKQTKLCDKLSAELLKRLENRS